MNFSFKCYPIVMAPLMRLEAKPVGVELGCSDPLLRLAVLQPSFYYQVIEEVYSCILEVEVRMDPTILM